MILSWNPQKSARMHGDLFLVEELEQVTEWLRSTMVWLGYQDGQDNYCEMAVWARMNLVHWVYLRRCADALADEYWLRFGRYYHIGFNTMPQLGVIEWINPPIEVPQEYWYLSIPSSHLNWYLNTGDDSWTSY